MKYYEFEVVKKKTSIEDLDRFVFSSSFAEEMVKNPEKFSGAYPFEKLVESIKKHGFVPNFLGNTLHGDIYPYIPLSFMLLEKDGKLRVVHGVHRMTAAKLAGIREIEYYTQVEKTYSQEQLNEFRNIVDFMNTRKGNPGYKDLFQTWEFPNCTFNSRDNSEKIFEQFRFPINTFAGRSVLDIACNTGYFAVRAALLGAEYVEGFDVIPETVELANRIAKNFDLKCEYNFFPCEFWDYKPSRQFDIVFCNQAIYHFTTKHRSKCLGDQDEVLDRISSWCKALFLMFTFVDSKAPIAGEGYYPSSLKLISDLEKRGFKTVIIYDHDDTAKSHVIASRFGGKKK